MQKGGQLLTFEKVTAKQGVVRRPCVAAGTMASDASKGRDSTGSSSSLYDLVKSLWSPTPPTSEGDVRVASSTFSLSSLLIILVVTTALTHTPHTHTNHEHRVVIMLPAVSEAEACTVHPRHVLLTALSV
jgi:hypothetical protein